MTFEPRDLAHLTRAYGMAEIKAPELFRAASVEASRGIANYRSQDLANIAWAFSKSKYESQLLFDAVTFVALENPAAFNGPALADLAWAYANAKVKAPHLVDALARCAPARVHECDADDLTHLVWAMAKMRIKQPDQPAIFAAVAREAVLKIASFDSDTLSTMAKAFQKAGNCVTHLALFDAIARQAVLKMHTFDEAALERTHAAFVKTNLKAHPDLFEAIVSAQEKMEDEMRASRRKAAEATQTISDATRWKNFKAPYDGPDDEDDD
mmetsp:Transcript_7666/g.27137  ORF Transcript_7666/g.27137 Transcript_7666/m.27137 type:complete len:268 (+) Transcript_7666:438-1241(+)